MVIDYRFILTRFFIGICIVLFCSFLFLPNAHAQTIGSYSIGGTIAVVDNLSSGYSIGVTGSPWANYGDGYLFLNFSLYKVSGSSTSANVGVRTIKVFSGSSSYVCYFGSNTVENSTFTNSSYSAMCPVFLGPSGVTSIWIGLQDNQQNSLSNYRLTADSIITFDQKTVSQNNDYSGSLGTINNNIGALGDYIVGGNQAIVDSQEENTQAIKDANDTIKDTNDTIKDDSVDDDSISSTIQNGASQIASNNSISQLLTLPISLYQNILNSVNGLCRSFSLGSLYNHQLNLPCINLQNILGTTLYGIIDVLISGLFILSFRKKMVDIFNNMTSLKDRGNELE